MSVGTRHGYGQYCGLARALDVVGDRWTLLIVRELLVGPRRFGALREGLCGIATNLLTKRLRQLESDGLVQRRLGAPGDGTRYALTPRGEALRPVVEALVRWSIPLMAPGQGDDTFHPHWLAVALPALLPGAAPRPVTIGVETHGAELIIEAGPAGTRVRPAEDGASSDAQPGVPARDAELSAPAEVILGLAAGILDLPAVDDRAEVRGDRTALARVFGDGTDAGRQS